MKSIDYFRAGRKDLKEILRKIRKGREKNMKEEKEIKGDNRKI